ncbi:MAG: C40 family peptidase [Lentisphaerae bacterium]|nr:C40 family peptidase [Lentisphaerota bacterium]
MEAVCLQYTPHWSTLQTVERLWRQFGFEDGEDAIPTTDDVARIAPTICAKFASGYCGKLRIGQITFELTDEASCSEFVRESCEAAAQTPDHGPLSTRYFGGTSYETERKMKARGTQIDSAQAVPGDVVCFNRYAGDGPGHIGIYLGGQEVAENTSSTKRGPGFVISTLGAIGRDRVSGWYHLPEFARGGGDPDTVKIILGIGAVPHGQEALAIRPRYRAAPPRCPPSSAR